MTDKQLIELYKQLIRDPSSDPVFNTFYQEAKAKFDNLLESAFNIQYFSNAESYNKLKEFLSDRYAKLYALATYASKKSTPLFQLPIDEIDEIFNTFGFKFHENLSESDKRLIIQNIAELVQKKGTNILEKVLQILFKFEQIELIDLDLIKDSQGEWNLVDPETGVRYRITDIQDNHWLTNLKSLPQPHQYRTPFFSFKSSKVKTDDVTTTILFINTIVRDELQYYIKTGNWTSEIYIDPIQTFLSFSELWLFTIVLYSTYIKLTTNNQALLEQPQSVVVFDEPFNFTDTFKTNVFNTIAQINNPQLKELTYSFYMQNYDRLEDVTYEEFDSYLASNWDDYYALEPEVRKAIIGSAFFYMKLAKYKSKDLYIEELWKELTRLPQDYIEKYVSCVEDPAKGLLYVFYDHFVKNYNDDNSFIVKNIIRNPEGQLNIINSKLIKFKDKIVDAYQEGTITADDLKLFLTYLLIKIATYLYTQYTINFPIHIYFGATLDFYSRDTIREVIDELKPVYARAFIGANVTAFEINNPLLDSIRYKLHDLLTIFQKLFDTIHLNDKVKETISLKLADIAILGYMHIYKYADPNFLAFLLQTGRTPEFTCLDSYSNISVYKDLKSHWICCDDGKTQQIESLCNLCKDTSSSTTQTLTEAAYNHAYYDDAVYGYFAAETENLKYVVSSDIPQCLSWPLFDAGIITPTRIALKTPVGWIKPDNLKVTTESDNYPVFSDYNLEKYKIVTGLPFDNALQQTFDNFPDYSVTTIADYIANDALISLLTLNAELLKQSVSQKLSDTLKYFDKINVLIDEILRDTLQLKDLKRLIVDQRLFEYYYVTESGSHAINYDDLYDVGYFDESIADGVSTDCNQNTNCPSALNVPPKLDIIQRFIETIKVTENRKEAMQQPDPYNTAVYEESIYGSNNPEILDHIYPIIQLSQKLSSALNYNDILNVSLQSQKAFEDTLLVSDSDKLTITIDNIKDFIKTSDSSVVYLTQKFSDALSFSDSYKVYPTQSLNDNIPITDSLSVQPNGSAVYDESYTTYDSPNLTYA